jgi:hypothetical protein
MKMFLLKKTDFVYNSLSIVSNWIHACIENRRIERYVYLYMFVLMYGVENDVLGGLFKGVLLTWLRGPIAVAIGSLHLQ